MEQSTADSGGLSGAALVIGANRGIGLELVRTLLSREGIPSVLATHRAESGIEPLRDLERQHPGRLQLLPLDFSEQDSLARFRDQLLARNPGLSLVIHAAGMLHEGELLPEKSLDQCEAERLLRLFEVNSIGPLLTARSVLSVQPRKSRLTYAAISAMVGSIGDNRLGGWYGYRASKAALNQFMRTLAMECRTKFPGACIVSIHPGTTDTELSRPFQARIPRERLYSPERTAGRILNVLSGLRPEHTGRFYNWDGTQIPW